MNCSTLFSYSSVVRITSEFPLSARVTIALLSDSFVLMSLMILDSACVLFARGCWLLSRSVLMRSAVSFLYCILHVLVVGGVL